MKKKSWKSSLEVYTFSVDQRESGMKRISTGLAGFAALLAAGGALAGIARIERLQLSAAGEETSLQVTLSETTGYRAFTLDDPPRLVMDIGNARLAPAALPLPSGAGMVRQVRVGNRPDGSVRVVLDLVAHVEPRTSATGNQILVSWPAATARSAAESRAAASSPIAEPGTAAASAAPRQQKQEVGAPRGRDVVIAIDAGHGGKDPGAHGPRGTLEKNVTLLLARRLADVIEREPGMRAVLTRNRDEFLPLRSRMERARAARADLFLSIHTDAVPNRSVRGASVYVLNEKGATDEAARRLAVRENAADLIGGVTLKDKDRMLASVLLDLSQNASLSSSIEVGDTILGEMSRVATVRKPRVMQAPFMVLKSPDVPSVLIETAYISNPEDERRLGNQGFRDQVARAILSGVRKYFYRNPPRGTLVAELSRRQLAADGAQTSQQALTVAALDHEEAASP